MDGGRRTEDGQGRIRPPSFVFRLLYVSSARKCGAARRIPYYYRTKSALSDAVAAKRRRPAGGWAPRPGVCMALARTISACLSREALSIVAFAVCDERSAKRPSP